MMKLWENRGWLLMWWFLVPFVAKAQHFRYEKRLDTVRQTGFYRIPITPDLSASMQTDLRDVRIWDDKKRPAPYIIRNRPPNWQNQFFKPFPVVENALNDSGNTELIFEKNVPQPITRFWIIQKNSTALRQATLSGSNDRKNWFVIEQYVLLNKNFEPVADSNFQAVEVAGTNYRFYKLNIDNEKKGALNIINVGHYADTQYALPPVEVANPDPIFSQSDSSNGITYIKVTQKQPYQVSRLSFEIEGQKFFSRDIKIYTASEQELHKPRFIEIDRYTLSATTISNAAIPVFKSKIFYLAISNGDNPSLQIARLHTGQGNREIVAWLEKGKQYNLIFDSEDALKPAYDLAQFSDSIPSTIPEILLKNNVLIAATGPTTQDKPFPRQYIWLIMGGIVALLGLLTWRLTTEMRKNV